MKWHFNFRILALGLLAIILYLIFKSYSVEDHHNDNKFMESFNRITENLFVYSAYYDDITDPGNRYIRIVAIDITEKDWGSGLTCQFHNRKRNALGTVKSIKVKSKDVYQNSSKANLVFFLCPLSSTFQENLTRNEIVFVKLLIDSQDPFKNRFLEIHYPPKGFYKYKVAMCIQPLSFPKIHYPLSILEWIEYNFLLGVEHITLYNYNVSKEILTLLEIYEREEKVLVLNWSVPLNPVHNLPWAQWVAASDCSNRYRGVAEYVIAMDTDEFLVPSKEFNTFPAYFDDLWGREKSKDENIVFIQFFSKVGFDNWPSGFYPSDLPEFQAIVNQLKIPTKTAVYLAGQSKFVMKPEFILESGVHRPTVISNGTIGKIVEREEAFYLHFRRCEAYYYQRNQVLLNNATCLHAKGVVQELSAAQRFGNTLVNRVQTRVSKSFVLRKLFLKDGS